MTCIKEDICMLTEKENTSQLLTKIENQQFLLEQKSKIIDEHIFMTISDTTGKIVDISQAYLDFTGYTREDVIGKNHSIFRNSNIDPAVIKNLWETILQNKVWSGELKNNKSTGEEYWIKTVIEPLYDINDIKIGYISIKEDITSNKRLEELSTKDQLTLLNNKRAFEHFLQKELNKFKSIKEKIALIIIDIDHYYDYKDKFGRSKAHKMLLDFSTTLQALLKEKYFNGETFKTAESEFTIVVLNNEDSFISELATFIAESIRELKLPNSENRKSNFLTLSIGTINLDTTRYNVTSHDLYNIADANLSQVKKLGGDMIVSKFNKEYIENLKNIDNITKLPNRNALVQDLAELQNEAMLILLHMNQLNSLKELYGFEFVSDIISRKSYELIEVLSDKETNLYNLNLQEFAILITDKKLFDKYLLLLKHSILASEDSEQNSTSNYQLADFTAGIAYGVEGIFNHADIVLQDAILTKVNYKTYKNNQSAKQLQEDNLSRLKTYKNALHTGNIIPYFQPIVDVSNSSIIKYEALARIETEDGEIISPYYFLDSAKEDKTFEYFTRQMMQKVFNIFAQSDIHVSINLTFENINSETMVDYIKNRLEKYGGDGITFEIVESEDILDYNIIENFITMIKQYGCKVSIDDFGSGYSNFTNIIKLDIDYIKLDGSLIQKLNTDANVKHMINGLLVYSKNANIKTIAEFVSSKELSDTVKELGIDYIQGYYYGEPKPPQDYGLI